MSQLRRSRLVMLGVIGLAVAAATGTGSAARAVALSSPTGLQAFQLRLGDEHGTFTATPSFAWKPVRSAARYQFELSTSKAFGAANGIVWSSRALTAPIASVPIALPWMTKRPMYWRVRAFGGDSVSPWSKSAVFKMQTTSRPRELPGGAGYIRWSPVTGATGYQVAFVNLKKTVGTTTTIADLRDYYGSDAPKEAVWRVRAERHLYGSDKRALPATSYGPWSKTYTTPVKPSSGGSLSTVLDGAKAVAQQLMPVFLFPSKGGTAYHVYVSKAKSCSDVVFNSPIVQGGAYAPRSTQYVASTHNAAPANAGPIFTKGGDEIAPSDGSRSELPAGRYVWTVVGVEHKSDGYHDVDDVEKACEAQSGVLVRTTDRPGVAKGKRGFATGLAPSGKVTSAVAGLYGSPLVAWRPAKGATRYEVQWSTSEDPWRTVGTTRTFGTSATLPLTPGTWWYRVRGIDGSMSGDQHMRWSAPVAVKIAKPTFTIVGA